MYQATQLYIPKYARNIKPPEVDDVHIYSLMTTQGMIIEFRLGIPPGYSLKKVSDTYHGWKRRRGYPPLKTLEWRSDFWERRLTRKSRFAPKWGHILISIVAAPS